ncbi:hypothetical protein RJ640_023273 [Escallonia rubra]|uniref:ACB domain-containing protein n=1 Tax=Escallonia rubra TaxID=112253 RepID=A0AA88UP39_9ASTE|nr:hypothetical protein RJ640_023273 [Escallonia rubra]
MADWQQYAQSIFIGFIFSFLLAKLISVVVSFREENLRVVRSDSPEPKPSPPGSESDAEGTTAAADVEPLIGEEKTSLTGDSDDDWEGVESTELDEAFSAATAFVAATAADKAANKVSTDVQLQLYGLYKIATEGPCGSPQPSALKMTARAKWQAWQKLGAMPPEDAMLKYIEIVTELYPSWIAGSTIVDLELFTSAATWWHLKMDAIHAFAREGDVENLIKCVESGVSVDLKDSEGRTPLHWAVDRGHLNITEMLVNKSADVNAKDNEGQTPLHYAAVCERESIAEFLVKHNANASIKDDDGNSSYDLCDSNWPWMQRAASQTA